MYMDNIQILGFKATINSVGETLNLIDSIKDDDEIIQLLNADSIVSKNHIIHGVNQAILAFDRGENLAKDLSVEIVLRCSAQRQISKAFKILGLKRLVYVQCWSTAKIMPLSCLRFSHLMKVYSHQIMKI